MVKAHRHQRKKKHLGIVLSVLAMLTALGSVGAAVRATVTGPEYIVYNGHLLDPAGDPISTAHTIRFSFWTSPDKVDGDINGDGSINTSAANYANWQESHTIVPNSLGYFTVEIGSIVGLPNIATMDPATFSSLSMQVELKASTAADTAFEMLDINPSSDSVDRSPVDAVPHALNADLIDHRDVGTGSGDIAILGPGGAFAPSQIGSGTNANNFILNFDDAGPGDTALQFGTTLAEKLSFNETNDRFELTDDLQLDGALTVGDFTDGTGTGAGTVRFTGDDFEGFDGTDWVSLTASGSTQSLFVGTTSGTTLGSFSTGALVGYQAANELCEEEYAGSHMCQTSEIITTIHENINRFSTFAYGWVAEGAPGFTSDSNDCRGWTSSDQADLGAWWEFSSDLGVTIADGGGAGFLTNCNTPQPIACCR